MLLVWCLLMLSALPGLHGRNLEVNWTLSGVEAYRDRSSPLRTELGDVLILRCERVSNLFIQAQEIQHNYCNASAGLGKYDYNGFCINGTTLMLTLTENSLSLTNTINFENNRLYYFASYSNNQLGDADDDSINSGGQCADGLKMVVLIGEDLTTPDPITPDTGGNVSGDDDVVRSIIIGASVGGALVGGGILFLLIIAVSICICLCCCCNSKNKTTTATVSVEKGELIDNPTENGGTFNRLEEQSMPQTNGKNVDKKLFTSANGNNNRQQRAGLKVGTDSKPRNTTEYGNKLQSEGNSKAAKNKPTNSITQTSSAVPVRKTGTVSSQPQMSKKGGITTEVEQGSVLGSIKQREALTNGPKSNTEKANNGSPSVFTGKVQTHIDSPKTKRNGTTNSTKLAQTHVDSPKTKRNGTTDSTKPPPYTVSERATSQVNGKFRGSKNTIQSDTQSSVAVHNHGNPSSNETNQSGRKYARAAPPPPGPPTQSLPPLAAGSKRNCVKVTTSLPPKSESKKPGSSRTTLKSNNNAVSYDNKSKAVGF